MLKRTGVVQSFLKHSSSLTPQYTAEKYAVKRGDYGVLTADDKSHLISLVNGKGIVGEKELEGYNVDWMRIVRGKSELMLKPETTSQVSSILKFCHSKNIAVVPQGGNTGLVGGSVPVFDEVILNTSLMNKVEEIDPVSGVVVAQAGCILDRLNSELAQHKLMMPLDLGAKGSCQLGGNIATNAGGLRLLRYGSLRGNVLGMEAVLADGTILDCMQTLRKDNTGYDIKQHFIGSEGTLGIITKASVLCAALPSSVNLAYLSVNDFSDVRRLFSRARQDLGEILSAFEFIDKSCLVCLSDNLKLSPPVAESPFAVVIETHGSNSTHDFEKLEAFLESVMSDGTVLDGCVAEDSQKATNLWQLRERMAESLMHDGYVYKYDVSIPLEKFYELVTVMRKRLGGMLCRWI